MSARVDSQHFLGRSPASVRLIDAFFETLPAERRDCLRRLQGQIDAVGVSVGTPAKAVENLMGTPTDRLSALLGYPATMAQKAQHLRAAGRLQR